MRPKNKIHLVITLCAAILAIKTDETLSLILLVIAGVNLYWGLPDAPLRKVDSENKPRFFGAK